MALIMWFIKRPKQEKKIELKSLSMNDSQRIPMAINQAYSEDIEIPEEQSKEEEITFIAHTPHISKKASAQKLLVQQVTERPIQVNNEVKISDSQADMLYVALQD